jgi:hypothetical protein
VSKKDYPYEPDEFDSVDPGSRPKEVHAARRSTLSRVWPFIVVIVVVPAIAFGVVKYLSTWENPNAVGDKTPASTSTITQTVIDLPTDTGLPVDPGTVTEPVPLDSVPVEEPALEPTEEPAPTESTEAPPPLDRASTVSILNAKGESGLAGRARDLLAGDGWTAVSAGDYDGSASDGASAVYYAKKSQATSAQAVANILQINEVVRDKKASPEGITAVLRSDYILP